MSWFKKAKYATISEATKKKDIPDGLWTKCENCTQIIYAKKLVENLKVCPKCNYHFRLNAYERIEILLDKNSFIEYDQTLASSDLLNFPNYKEKLSRDREKTKLLDAVVCGEGKINNYSVILTVTDSRFLMGSMGSVVGEKITRSVERANEKNLPLIIVSGTGGGARMYEGILSLMQMAKTSIAIARLKKIYISVLTDPTMAGVLASFASIGDIIMAEPGALIGFTGPRVIEKTIKQTLPPNFQSSEFQLQHGMVDMIVERKELKQKITTILKLFA